MKHSEYIDLECKYGANNYAPLPVVLCEGKGAIVKDVNGREYFDFLSAYSAVNQGHCHPKIISALTEQASRLTLTSRAFYNDQLGPLEKRMCTLFGFDRVLLMNSGAEAVETAIKISRKWGYKIKGIPDNKGKVVVCENNFHGRTVTIISFSSDEGSKQAFGPYTDGFITVPYSDTNALEEVFKKYSDEICAFLVEPIQGEAGVVLPNEGYLKKVRSLCTQYNILFVADEVQTGLGRTGKMLACNHEEVLPDVLILGKALSGGVYPVSAVLAKNEVMEVIKPGQHGSTFGGNPLAARVALVSLEVLIEEQLPERAEKLGNLFRSLISEGAPSGSVEKVRGKGLLTGVVINQKADEDTAYKICLEMLEQGMLAKQTRESIIRLAPPLVITEEQIRKSAEIFVSALKRVFA